MIKVINDIEEIMSPENYKATVSSRIVATRFGKNHKDLLNTIRSTINDLDDSEFSRRNFTPSDYINSRGKKYQEYQMTMDGFSLIVMGFTGKEAAQFKVAYIKAFRKLQDRYLKLRKDYVSSRNKNQQSLDTAEEVRREYMTDTHKLSVDKAMKLADLVF